MTGIMRLNGFGVALLLVLKSAATAADPLADIPLVRRRNLTQHSGTFHSTNYPGNYPNSVKFGFLLEAPPKTAANISVNFVDFALETSKRCSDYDYVKVYKQDIGSDTWTGITPAYCGARSIPPITAVSQRLLVKFVSDATNNDRGFNATYSIETAKAPVRRRKLANRTGTFHSTNYPGKYPNGVTIEFVLEAPPRTAGNISVNFVDFALEPSKRCLSYDYVKIYKQDVGSDTWTEITPAYCGTRSIPPITAVSQRLLVKFVSDATNNDRGFNATYSIETAKGCCSVGLGNKLPPKPPCSGSACPSRIDRSHPPNSESVRPPKVMPTPSMSRHPPKQSGHPPGGSQRPPGASMNRPHPSPARSHSGPHASQYPRPSMPPQGSGRLEPKRFLTMFYRHFYNAVQIAMKQRQEKGMGASMHVMPTPHPPKRGASARVMPSPYSPKKDVPQMPNQLNVEIDAIFGLLISDFLGRRFAGGNAWDNKSPSNMPMNGQQTLHVRPTPPPGQKMTHRLMPSPANSKHVSGKQEAAKAVSKELQMFRSIIKQGLHGRKQCLKDLLLRGNVDVKNNTRFNRYVERNMQNITVVYFKFIRWLTEVKKDMPCNKDCQNIERMVAFCKNQYKACGGSMPKGSIRIMPTPAGTLASKCPKGQKMCPMRRECVPDKTHCIDSRNPFVADTTRAPTASAMPGMRSRMPTGGHSIRHPQASPMPPRKSVGMGSKAWNLRPTPSAMPRMNFNDTLNRTVFAKAFKAAAKRNPNLDHKEMVRLYKFMQSALGGKGMGNGNGNTPPNSKPEEKQPHDACMNMCPKKNMTFCWPEMKCKPRGAHCNLMHLAAMMNTSRFENMTKCRGSFYCPITGNCTMDAKSCDPSNSRIFDNSPRNETCLTPNMAKPANISGEMAEMFRLRCKPTEKYCPNKYGCISKKENCTRSKDLRVMLQKTDEHEKKIFCRIRDLICPRVYYKWVNMKRTCPEQVKPNAEEGPPSRSLPPWVKPTRSHGGPPVHTGGVKPRPTNVGPRPTARPPTGTSGQPKPTSMPSRPKLKSVVLDVGRSLQGQMGLPPLVNYIAVVAVTDCPVNWKYITMRIRQGAPVRIPKKTDAPKMKAAVLPLDAVIKYEVKDKHFHGVCILKYYKYTPARGVRPSLPMEADVDDSMSSGDLFLVVFPKPPPCDVQLFGRNFVEILEDTKRPPTFKLRNFIRMRNDSGPVVSKIPSAVRSVLSKDIVDKYERIVQASQGRKCNIAILGYTGIPWRDGSWKFKGQVGALRSFPISTSKIRPLILSCNDSVTFYPKQDFDGKVCLFIRGACGEMVNGREKFQVGDRDIKFCIHVKGQPDPPKLTTTFSCLTPLPFSMPTNKGFSIVDIIRYGKRSCGNTRFQGARGEPLVAGLPAGKETSVGIAVVDTTMPIDIGEWQFKAGSEAFSPLTKRTFRDGYGVCLNATSVLRFKPKNATTLWSVSEAMRSVWIKIVLWGPRHANATGLCNTTDTSNGLFSPVSKPIQLSLQRKGCDGVAGSEKKPDLCGYCGKKKFSNVRCGCDKRPNSDAVIDECGRCSGGATGRVFHKRDCGKKCYANGTLSENFLDSCGICQVRKYARRQARDCNNDCSFGRRRACTNKCGICVGGKTGKALNDGINNCGGCTANASSICVKKLTMHSAARIGANEKFNLVLRATGFVSFRKLKCFVQKAGGALIEIGDGNSLPIKPPRPTVIDEDKCNDEPSREFQVRLQPTIRNAGTYAVTCKVDNEASAMNVDRGSLEVISTGISITGYQPRSIPTGENVTIVIMGTGFTNTPGAICRASCEKSKSGTKNCMMETTARFLNETAVECAFLSTMQAQEINLHLLSSTAVTEPRFSRASPVITVRCPFPRAVAARFTSGIRRIKITLTGVASLVPGIRPACSSLFDVNTVQKFGKDVICVLRNKEIYVFFLSPSPRIVADAVGNKVRIGFSNNNLRCRGQKFFVAGSGSTQNLEIPLPTANVKAVISHGGDTLGTCDQMRFYGYKSKGGEGGRLQYFWELFKGATSQGPNKTRSWFKVDGKKLDANSVYTCKLCVKNMFRQSDCTTRTFRTLDNQNSSLILRIRGGETRILKAARRYRLRPHVKISQCGRAAKALTTLRYIWELKPKDPSDDATLQNNDRRNLVIKSGDLTPGHNYTLKLLVTDEKDSTLTAEAAVELSVTGSPLQARIRGGKEMTVGCNGIAVFDARTSIDPDATKTAARVIWECTEESGRPCFKTSDASKRVILEEKDQVSLPVNGSLECDKVYIFKMTYSKDSRSSSASIKLTTKPGSPSEVKLDYKRYRNIFRIDGYMRSISAANATWKCVEEEGFDCLDLLDETLVKVGGALSIRPKRRGKHVARRPRLILFTKNLPAGTKYKIQLEVINEDGVSTAETIVTPPSPPVKGEVTIEPAEGRALNTSFTISGDVGWGTEGEDLRYEVGYEEKTRRGIKETVIKPFSEDNVLEDVKLPPGLDDENSTLRVYVKAKNADGLTSKTVKKIRCRKPSVISSSEVTDFMAQSKKAFEEGNIEEANRILNTLAGTVNNAEVNGSAVNEEMTAQTVNILGQATDDTRPGILSTLRSTTKPSSIGTGLQGGTKENVAQALFKIFAPERITQSSSKRKRRSVGVTVTETFTPKTTEEVDSSMEVFDNIIDENEISSFQDNMKKNFTDTVPSLLRSLCAGLVSSDEYLISKNNLSTIRSNRLTAATFDTANFNLTDGSSTATLLLGSELKEKYENWNCSNSGLLCTELCVGTVLYHHSMYPGEFTGRVSDIADVILVHPETYALETPSSLTTGMQYDLALNEIPDSQHTIECRTWNAAGSNWTTDGCVTTYSAGASVACNCTTFDSVTAFKVQKPIITTLFPPVTTNATSVQSTSSTGNNGSSSAGITPTQSTSTYTGQRGSQSAVVVTFKFNVDYNTYAYGSKYNTLKQSIIDMLVQKLNISASRIVNLELKSGSIIVTFTLLNNSGYSNEGNVANIQALITTLAQNGSLVVTLHDGTKVAVDAASLVFAPPTTTMPPKPHPKPKKKDHVVIIIVVVVAVIVAIIVLVLVRYYMIQRARKTKMDDGRTQSSTMLVIDNIKLQDRQRTPESDTTYNNQAYEKSPALAHRKDPSPPPAYEKPKTPSTPPTYEKPRTPTTPLPEKPNTPGGTVTAGIGSSVSLKDKYFNS